MISCGNIYQNDCITNISAISVLFLYNIEKRNRFLPLFRHYLITDKNRQKTGNREVYYIFYN